MAMSKQQEFDIIVVGAGLVGAAFALSLAAIKANQSLSIGLIEAGKIPCDEPDLSVYDPRVVALTAASKALLEQAGAWDEIVQQRVSPYFDMSVWDAEGTGSIEFAAAEVQQPALGYIVENSVALRALHQRLQDCPNICVLQGEKIEQVLLPSSSGGKQVLAILASGQTLKAPLLVAADGAQSKVRTLVNLPVREWDYGQKAIVTTIKCERSHSQTARQRFLRSGPLAFLPLADEENKGCFSSIVWSCDTDKAEQLMALDDEAFCNQLGQAFEHRLGRVEQTAERFCLPLWQRHAKDYYKPGVALVGDAAHTIHPLAGQGVNLGFQDAAMLAQEIERACERGIPLGETQILRRYQRVRKQDNLAMMAAMESFKRLFGSDDMLLRWLRNEGMRRVDSLSFLKNTVVKRAMGL